jgi:WD40 repeat protein
MPRKVSRSIGIKNISAIFVVILIWMSLVPISEATAPAWSYCIEGITASAMSRNGAYIIIGTQEGYFYVFDKFGNTVRSDYATEEITAVDISDNGTFLVGTDKGFYTSTLTGTLQINTDLKVRILSVSVSDNSQYAIVGTEREIFLFSNLTLVNELSTCERVEQCTETDWVKMTDISSSGSIAGAATDSTLYLYEREKGRWAWREFIETRITALAVSGNGQTVACGTEGGDIYVFDSQFEYVVSYEGPAGISNLEITEDGNYVLCKADDGLLALLGIDGENVWEKEPMGFKSISMSHDATPIAAVGEKLCLFHSSGRALQEISLPGELHTVFLSNDGQYMCCVSSTKLLFFDLYDYTVNFAREYTYPSRKSLPLSDTLVRREGLFDNIDNPRGFQVGDINGDGKNEVVSASGNNIVVADKYGKILTEIKFTGEPRLRKLLDVTGDFIPEIIVGHKDGRMALKFYDGNGTLLAQHEFYKRWWKEPVGTCSIFPLAAFDIDGDEKIEVICLVSAGYEETPRGIYTFEYPAFSDEWYYPYAPIVSTPALVDLDGDGDLEILFGSSAPCNGRTVGDTDDCRAYVAAIDLEGKELWIREIGAGFKRVWIDVADLDGDGINEIVCGGWSSDDTWGKLFILDQDGGYVSGEDNVFSHSLFLEGVSDFDDDGKMEILTFSSNGNIMIFDYLLNLVKEKKIDITMGVSAHALINDIDADDEKEIIVYSNDETVYILDSNLEIEWTGLVTGATDRLSASITTLYGCKNDLILVGDNIYVYSHQYDTETDLPCPLWAITERNLTKEGNYYIEMAESAFIARRYITSRDYYEDALVVFEKLENEEKITELSETISRLNIRIGMILLAVCDAALCVFLVYSWLTRSWSRLAEGILLLSLPVLLGLYEVHSADKEYLQIFVAYTIPSSIGATAVILRQNVLGFSRAVAAILSGHKNMLVLSIMKSYGSYRVGVESIEEKFRPVKESRKITFSEEMRDDLIKKVEYTIEVLNKATSGDHVSLDYARRLLRKTGTEIYRNVIPEDFFDILKAKFLLLEVEDTEIPWELMYADDFFLLKYAISRRIVTTESVNIYHKKKRRKRALIISDPRENLPGAEIECDIVYKRLAQKMDTVLVKGREASIGKTAIQLNQGFDIIHFACHVDNGLLLSDGVMTPEEIKRLTVGTPIVFVNGCKSEELAKAFLLGGAMAYVGTIYPVHDSSAAIIAADFYDLCLQHQIGEALRRARISHITKDLVWASLVMYGDPTLKLL